MNLGVKPLARLPFETTAEFLQRTARIAFDPRRAYLACNRDGVLRICQTRVPIKQPDLGMWAAVDGTVMR